MERAEQLVGSAACCAGPFWSSSCWWRPAFQRCIAVEHSRQRSRLSVARPSSASGLIPSHAAHTDRPLVPFDAGLVAYTNTQSYLVGPRGMRCSGIVAADGGSQVIVWPQGHSRPSFHAHTAGLTLTLDPAAPPAGPKSLSILHDARTRSPLPLYERRSSGRARLPPQIRHRALRGPTRGGGLRMAERRR